MDPLPLLVSYGGTGTVGGIAAGTETWWKNQTVDDSSTTFAGFLKALRNMYNLCSKGGGGGAGSPDLHLSNQDTFELYESALAALHQNYELRERGHPVPERPVQGLAGDLGRERGGREERGR